MMRRLRALLSIVSVLLLSTGALAGQSQSPTSVLGGEAIELLKWGVTQGGLTVVVIIMILSELRRSAALMETLRQATTALATHAESSRQQAAAFLHLSESVRLCEAVRKMIAEREP